MIFRFLDRVAASKKMPLKIRFAASDLQMRMSPEGRQIDQLLREDRVDEANAIAEGMPSSYFAKRMEMRVHGTRMRLSDQKIREERAQRLRNDEVAAARLELEAKETIESRSALEGVSRKGKTFIRSASSDDRGEDLDR
jgi:hypothetical protein